MTPEQEQEFYADPDNQVPEGPPVRRTGCRCDGRYEGCEHEVPCPSPAGGYRSPYFCADCDRRRIEHITAAFDRIIN